MVGNGDKSISFRQGKLEKSIDYLMKFVEVTEQSGEEKGLSKACHNLGNIFNSLVSHYIF